VFERFCGSYHFYGAMSRGEAKIFALACYRRTAERARHVLQRYTSARIQWRAAAGTAFSTHLFLYISSADPTRETSRSEIRKKPLKREVHYNNTIIWIHRVIRIIIISLTSRLVITSYSNTVVHVVVNIKTRFLVDDNCLRMLSGVGRVWKTYERFIF